MIHLRKMLLQPIERRVLEHFHASRKTPNFKLMPENRKPLLPQKQITGKHHHWLVIGQTTDQTALRDPKHRRHVGLLSFQPGNSHHERQTWFPTFCEMWLIFLSPVPFMEDCLLFLPWLFEHAQTIWDKLNCRDVKWMT
jgi:hypothetical protein